MSVRAVVVAAVMGVWVAAHSAAGAVGKIDQVLAGTVEVSADRAGLRELLEKLAGRAEGMNLVVNWPALKAAGVTQETRVSLRLHGVTLEAGIRGILESIRPELNYVVGDGAVEITTNAEIGKKSVERFYDLKGLLRPPVGFVLGGKEGNGQQVLWGIFTSELLRIGERVEGEGRELKIDGNAMAVTTSMRGHAAIQHALFVMGNPARPGTFPPGSAVSVAAKKAGEELKGVLGKRTVGEMAGDLSSVGDLSVMVGPGSAEEVKSGVGLGSFVDFSGVVIVGPAAVVREPVMMAVFDVRELLKRMAVRSGVKAGGAGPAAGDFSDEVVAGVKGKVHAEWGEMGKAGMSVGAYHGLVVVFAPAAVVREVSGVLQEMK